MKITEDFNLCEEMEKLPVGDKVYAGTVIPLWLSITIYMFIGIPIL